MNLSTDLILLLIPVTLIIQLKMRIGKKLLLICLFSMGVFVMLCAILMKVTVFTNPSDPVWFLWSVREVSTAMLVGNLVLGMPILRSLWRCFVPGAGDSMGDKPSTADSGATSTVTKSGAGDPAVLAASEPGALRPVPPKRMAINSVYTDVDLYGQAGPGGTSQKIWQGQESV
ncbi:hypothetical protein CGRA01v4_05069 [Colletotrichum graminicola]|nr:hypothetical protein CGRA01v4_05069 [Colletotrichum graminicola]